MSPLVRTILTGVFVALWVAHAALAGVSFSYFDKLRMEKCACATDSRGTTLFALSGAYLVMVPLFLASMFFPVVQQIRPYLSLINLGIVVTFLVLGMDYLREIEKERCACARDDPRWRALRAWLYLWIAQLSIAVLMIVLLLLVVFFRPKLLLMRRSA